MEHQTAFDKSPALVRCRCRGLGLLSLAVLVLGLAACQRGTNLGVSLPPTPQLFGSLPWGLVNITYSKGFVEPRLDSPVAIVLRGGDVVKILGRSQQQERVGTTVDYWYQVQIDKTTFWIFGNLLSFYGLEMQARTASEIVRDKLFTTP